MSNYTEQEKNWILAELAKVKEDPKNKNKGLIPRFQQEIADRFYGGAKKSLSKVCQEMVDDKLLFKSFVKFAPAKNDVIEEGTVVSGMHKGMKVGKDDRLSTPIYWLAGDTDIPGWAVAFANRADSYRKGAEEFGVARENLV